MINDFFPVVAVGASAGGQQAIEQFFRSIPVDTPAAFVVITHLQRNYESRLTQIISRFTALPVCRISGFTAVRQGVVFVMPENVMATIREGVLYLTPRPPEIINRSIDVFFKSLAADQGPQSIAVVLSGMGSDGAEGALDIFHQNGIVMVQEPASTEFNSMPWTTIMKDHPDYILPPEELGKKVVELIATRIVNVAS